MGKKRRIDRIINNMKIVAALAILLSSVELSTAGDSIYDLAKATDDLSTLAVAIEAAGLEETLSDCHAGPFTVLLQRTVHLQILIRMFLQIFLNLKTKRSCK